MKDYNGFPGGQRAKAQRWLTAQWAAGTLKRPQECVACGQAHGLIEAHAEDYSEPFGAGKTDEFHLCFTCHMMVHCRFSNPRQFAFYRAAVMAGCRFAPIHTRGFWAIKQLLTKLSAGAMVDSANDICAEPAVDVLGRIAGIVPQRKKRTGITRCKPISR